MSAINEAMPSGATGAIGRGPGRAAGTAPHQRSDAVCASRRGPGDAAGAASPGGAPGVPHEPLSCGAPGLYVHVPFCETKCPYCDFYSSTTCGDIPHWLDCLARETDYYKDVFFRFDTVYLGGGTPSLLDKRELSQLLNSIAGAFDVAGDSEITMELNPDDVTPSKLAAYRDLGINRISLGVQSLSDTELRFLGRRHDANQSLNAIKNIRNAGFNNLGIDLMYGFEVQSIAAWKRTLRRVLELSPEHLSCYQMAIEPETHFGAMRDSGTLTEPGEDLQRRFFLATSELLRAHGYIHYEISNFARSEEYLSRHNSKYWRHVPYLGLGPAAHSFKEGKRWWNVPSVDGYCRALETGTAPLAGSERLTPKQLALERLFLGLRTRDGIDLDDASIDSRAHRALSTLKEESLVEIANGRITPTLNGFLFADEMPFMFY
jgi:putative oxygen-independent coproporphyrinogen III oxidase